MKKFIASAILLASAGLATFAADSTPNPANETAANSANAAQINVRIGRGGRRYVRPVYQRRARVTTTVRTVRRGRFLYRDTYRTTYFANGRVNNRLVRSVVIRRY